MAIETERTPDERFAAAEAAYASGDFARVRAQCAALAGAGDPELAKRAQLLAARVSPDLSAFVAVGASLALFLGILVAYAS